MIILNNKMAKRPTVLNFHLFIKDLIKNKKQKNYDLFNWFYLNKIYYKIKNGI